MYVLYIFMTKKYLYFYSMIVLYVYSIYVPIDCLYYKYVCMYVCLHAWHLIHLCMSCSKITGWWWWWLSIVSYDM